MLCNKPTSACPCSVMVFRCRCKHTSPELNLQDPAPPARCMYGGLGLLHTQKNRAWRQHSRLNLQHPQCAAARSRATHPSRVAEPCPNHATPCHVSRAHVMPLVQNAISQQPSRGVRTNVHTHKQDVHARFNLCEAGRHGKHEGAMPAHCKGGFMKKDSAPKLIQIFPSACL